jgi:Uma2 family endonuclease
MATVAEHKLMTAEEVYSPGNRPGEINKKIAECLEAGTLMVWVVYPSRRCVVIYRPNDEPPRVLCNGDVLENLPELPGFRCSVADFFV